MSIANEGARLCDDQNAKNWKLQSAKVAAVFLLKSSHGSIRPVCAARGEMMALMPIEQRMIAMFASKRSCNESVNISGPLDRFTCQIFTLVFV